MKAAMKTIMCGRRIAALSICTGCLLSGATAMAAASYSYENDNKTYVATVTSAETAISSEAINVLNSNAVTNFIKRGDKTLTVYNSGANAFTGDVTIENSSIVVGGTNPLGPSGKISINNQRAFVFSKATVAKDVLFAGGAWNDNTKISVWAGTSQLNGKLMLGGESNVVVTAYDGARMTFANGFEDAPGSFAYPYFIPTKGSTFVFANRPVNMRSSFFIKPNTTQYPLASDGFAGRFVFSVAGNKMGNLGFDNGSADSRLNWCQLKTTVDYVFDVSAFGKVWMGHDSEWDLCGTTQRIKQLDVKVRTGNPSVITNSFATPATLYMGMMYNYWNGNAAPIIRFGGNLSVVFENNFYDTMVNYEMTATGDLIINGTGTLAFQENGSWANAANVAVNSTTGKITIANPNALGRKTNVSLKSNSSLEIASGVTVTVNTLTVGGVQKPAGNYTFGSGTLSVLRPRGFMLSVQ